MKMAIEKIYKFVKNIASKDHRSCIVPSHLVINVILNLIPAERESASEPALMNI